MKLHPTGRGKAGNQRLQWVFDWWEGHPKVDHSPRLWEPCKPTSGCLLGHHWPPFMFSISRVIHVTIPILSDTTVSTRCQSSCPTKYFRVEDILCYIFPFVTLVRWWSAGPPAEMLYLPSSCPQNMSSQHRLGLASKQIFLFKIADNFSFIGVYNINTRNTKQTLPTPELYSQSPKSKPQR